MNDSNLIDDPGPTTEKDYEEIEKTHEELKKKKEKKKSIFTKKETPDPKTDKSIKRGICQLCGANIGRGKKHLKACKLA